MCLQKQLFYHRNTYSFNVNCAETLRLSKFFRTVPLGALGALGARFRYEVWQLGSGFRGFLYHSLAAVPLLTLRCDA